jgi:cation transport protein ChaC
MALTAELVARCARAEPDPGPEPGYTHLTEPEFDALAADLLARRKPGPLWLFAYGSLIWKPEFTAVEHCRATAHGWHRAFTLGLTRWRGSPNQPGLMMALEPGGRCEGVAYRLPDTDHPGQMGKLLRREVATHEDVHGVRWITVETAQGNVEALSFWTGVRGPTHAGKRSLHQVAEILARACGHLGSGADYLFQTVSHLEELGIRDRSLWRLQALVAKEIERLSASP